MLLNRVLAGALVLAAVISARVGRAQEPSASAPHDTVMKSTTDRGTGVAVPSKSNAVQLCIDCHGWWRASDMPAMIFKDAEQRVLMMSAPGDTIAGRDTTEQVEPSWVANIDIVKPAAAAATLGAGFEKGIVVITLTPAGSDTWRRRRAQRVVPRCAP